MYELRPIVCALLGALIGVILRHAAISVSREELLTKPPFLSYGTVLWALFCGLTAAFLSMRYRQPAEFYLAFAACCAAQFHAQTDWLCGYIYDRAVIVTIVSGLTLRLCFYGSAGFVAGLLGILAGSAPAAVLIVLTKGSMGWGDATMMAGLGALLGWKITLLTFYFGLIAGGICALLLLVAGRVRCGDALPLAPFILAGLLAALIVLPEFAAKISWFVSFL